MIFFSRPTTLSPLATQVHKMKDGDDRTAPVFGLCVHTTGSTIVSDAMKLGVDPLAHAVEYYMHPESYSPHYVVGHSGTIIQIADENERALHVGLTGVDRAKYLSGKWIQDVPLALADLWAKRWGSEYKSPSHLYPGSSPNNVYVGVEMLPLVPTPKGLRFTDAQHGAVRDLALDLAKRHSWPDYWWHSGRLVGHEDVTPMTRKDAVGGWDPGFLRLKPYFDFDRVRHGCGGYGLEA